MSNKPQKQYDFSKMVAFDFNTICANSTNNCFGCDCNCDGGPCDCNCDCNDCDCDCNNFCDLCDVVPDYEPKQEEAISLEKIAEAEEYRNKILLTGVQTRGNHF